MNQSNFIPSKLALFIRLMSTVTGCVLCLPAAYAINPNNSDSTTLNLNTPSDWPDQLKFHEDSSFNSSPVLVSGPYNFDPSLTEAIPPATIVETTPESLNLLGQPTIIQTQQQKLLVRPIKTDEVKEKNSPTPEKQEISSRKVQEQIDNLPLKEQTINRKLYKIAEKEFDQVERLKLKQLKQAERKFKHLEDQEQQRLKEVERDRQKALKVAQQEQQKLEKQEKLRQKKEEKARRIAEKIKQRQLAIAALTNTDEIDKQNIEDASEEKEEPFITPTGIELNFTRDINKSGQLNQISEGTALFKLFNGDQLSVTSGYNIYDQESIDRVNNIPIKLGWEHDIGDFKISAKAGIDLYNRLQAVPNFSINAEKSINVPKSWGTVFLLSGEIDHAQYKFNAETIENDIRYLRLKGSLFWQMKENTSFFTSAHIGTLNDNNFEHQVFSRLEKKIARNFSVAGNLFIWGFSNDRSSTSGYFSPPDFLVYNGEIAWKDNLTNFLNCKIAVSLGRQRAQGEWSNASSLTTNCRTRISKNLEFELGYEFSNSFSDTNISNSTFFANRFTANVKAKF